MADPDHMHGGRHVLSDAACYRLYTGYIYHGKGDSGVFEKGKPPCDPPFPSRMTRALMDSLGPEWRLKLPAIPVVPVSVQKKWNALPSENHRETAKSKSKETTATKNRGL